MDEIKALKRIIISLSSALFTSITYFQELTLDELLEIADIVEEMKDEQST